MVPPGRHNWCLTLEIRVNVPIHTPVDDRRILDAVIGCGTIRVGTCIDEFAGLVALPPKDDAGVVVRERLYVEFDCSIRKLRILRHGNGVIYRHRAKRHAFVARELYRWLCFAGPRYQGRRGPGVRRHRQAKRDR